jgi:hypothetical protein
MFRHMRTKLLVLAIVLIAAAPAQAQEADEPSFTLTWVGDIAFSRDYGLPPNGGDGYFKSVEKLLGAGDISTGNLEGTLGRGGPSKCKGNCFAFQAPPTYAAVLERAGLQLVNMANNHSNDYGATGMSQTLAALKGAGLAHTGLKGEVTVQKVNGVKVAFLGFAPYPWASPLTNIPAARSMVAAAAKRAPVVVVFIHAGAEGSGATHVPHGTETAFGENRGNSRAFAHGVIDSGADAVLGSGPHVLRGIECYRHAVIAYSLGNFASYRTLGVSGTTALSGVLKIRVSGDGVFQGGQLWPVKLQGPGQPVRDGSRASVKLVRKLSSQDFGKRACPMTKKGAISPR